MTISYHTNRPISAGQFIDLLERSTLAGRRPVGDGECMEGMLANSDLLVTAWEGNKLVGIARSITDFHYACYLSDLAVDLAYQSRGIGRILQQQTQIRLGPHCKLIVVAAPAADGYYGHIGYTRNPRCWVLERDEVIC